MQYVITDVADTVNEWTAQGKYPMKEYRVHLDEGGRQYLNVEWSRKAESPAPVVGQKLDIERLEDRGSRGLKLHLAQKMDGGSPSGDKYKADPAKQAAIAMESAQKSAVEIMRLAMECKAWLPSQEVDGRPVSEMIGTVKVIAAALYDQITEVSEAAK